MDTLQKIFVKELQDSLTFPVVGTKLIRRQMEKKGIILTENQVDELEKKLKDITPELKEGQIERIARNYKLYASWYKESE